MTDRELLQMALDALESSRVFVTSREKIKHPEGTEWYDERIEALRARLAQPEPPCKTGSQCVGGKCERCAVREPLADKRLKIKLGSQYGSDLCGQWFYLTPADDNASKALIAHTGITAPPQREWQGLTAKDLAEIPPSCYEGAIWAEAKLKEKNT